MVDSATHADQQQRIDELQAINARLEAQIAHLNACRCISFEGCAAARFEGCACHKESTPTPLSPLLLRGGP